MKLLDRARNNLWLLGACRDWRTLRAMKSHAASDDSVIDELDLLDALRFRGLASPVLYRPGSTDVSVAWELFQKREYECTRAWDFRSIVDCGANVGMFLAFAVMKMNGALERYAGVEPDPASFQVLEQQAASLGIASKCRMIPAAAWHADGEVRFDDAGPSWSRHVSDAGRRCARALTIDSILDAAEMSECDLLKLDIEGGERGVLPQMKTWGRRVRTVVAELHDGLDYRWFAAIADESGFEPFPPGALFRLHPSAIRRA